jgi:hypothetical protein
MSLASSNALADSDADRTAKTWSHMHMGDRATQSCALVVWRGRKIM